MRPDDSKEPRFPHEKGVSGILEVLCAKHAGISGKRLADKDFVLELALFG